ncbi:hypothetical protein TWF481_002607 [Arthrobotrys musiformis]|uniref:Uncharacterized protein n=1 Tax=Arthrobotrys musiformis TaxID=47236 RepID=A0AAV9VSE4_9PEZI
MLLSARRRAYLLDRYTLPVSYSTDTLEELVNEPDCTPVDLSLLAGDLEARNWRPLSAADPDATEIYPANICNLEITPPPTYNDWAPLGIDDLQPWGIQTGVFETIRGTTEITDNITLATQPSSSIEPVQSSLTEGDDFRGRANYDLTGVSSVEDWFVADSNLRLKKKSGPFRRRERSLKFLKHGYQCEPCYSCFESPQKHAQAGRCMWMKGASACNMCLRFDRYCSHSM